MDPLTQVRPIFNFSIYKWKFIPVSFTNLPTALPVKPTATPIATADAAMPTAKKTPTL